MSVRPGALREGENPVTGAERFLPPILLALVVAIVPQLSRLPVWVIVWCAAAWGYLFLSLRKKWPLPGRLLRNILTFSGILGLLFTFRTIGADAYTGLLAVMAGIKPFEIRNHRDRMITLFLAYFTVIACLLQSESLTITIYMFISVLITTAALIRINNPQDDFRRQLGLSARIMGEAIPLMVILFFLFPRMPGSLFGFSRAAAGKAGFSDSMSPGSVTSLAENHEIAFRAEFKGKIPPPTLLYWRGIVLKEFDGRTWLRDYQEPEQLQLIEGERPEEYTITLEPHGNKWLFALDVPAKAPPAGTLHTDSTLISKRRVNRTLRYEMQSYAIWDSSRIPPEPVYTRLPASGNPKSRVLAQTLAKNGGNPEQIAGRMLGYFKTNGFVYTLEPPALGRDPIDTFLFRTKKGYCEHYASALAFIMRAAGVPSRVVGGYLGGEINPYGNYLIVRQSHAHAWVEVWDQRKGWIRVDPTSAVAPERINAGTEGLFPLERVTGTYIAGIINFLRFGWDSINLQWEAWFSGYSYDQQMAFLRKLGIGIDSGEAPLIALLIILGLMFIIVGGYTVIHFRGRRKTDPVRDLYENFCGKLGRSGFQKKPGQGPRDYAAEVIRKRPDLRETVSVITECYIRLRYAPVADGKALDSLRAAIRAFKPSGNQLEKTEAGIQKSE